MCKILCCRKQQQPAATSTATSFGISEFVANKGTQMSSKIQGLVEQLKTQTSQAKKYQSANCPVSLKAIAGIGGIGALSGALAYHYKDQILARLPDAVRNFDSTPYLNSAKELFGRSVSISIPKEVAIPAPALYLTALVAAGIAGKYALNRYRQSKVNVEVKPSPEVANAEPKVGEQKAAPTPDQK